MKVSDIPFDMTTELGDDLREHPCNKDQMLQGIEFLSTKYHEGEVSEKEKALIASMLGVFYRIVEKVEDSETMLELAKNQFQNLGADLMFWQAELRLASTLTVAKKYAAADKVFKNFLIKCRQADGKALRKLEDYALFHLGRLKFEQGFFAEAMEIFSDCFEARIVRGDLAAIESTKKAMEVTQLKIGE